MDNCRNQCDSRISDATEITLKAVGDSAEEVEAGHRDDVEYAKPERFGFFRFQEDAEKLVLSGQYKDGDGNCINLCHYDYGF